MHEVVMPAVGIAMKEGTVVQWLKAPGDAVTAGEPLVEIETDKASMVIESPASGRLGPLLYVAGEVVPIGVSITTVFGEGETVAPARTVAPSVSTDIEAPSDPAAREYGHAGEPQTGHRLSPRQRNLDVRPQVDRAEEDLARHEIGRSSSPGTGAGRHRQLIASRVSEAWRQIPHFAVTRELRAERMLSVREESRRAGLDTSFTDLMIRALAVAIKGVAAAESTDVGLAVASNSGVVLPVIRNVLALSLPGLIAKRSAAVARGREGRLVAEDLDTVPVATLSNRGMYGVDQ
ncbi:MAG: 2-oxo acid dehydrogenase subunit E2, partial [Aggregatilineales bacterium]